MNDLISRQAAIEATWFEPSYTDPLNVLTEVRDRLKALPSAQPEQRWIPCDKGEPDEDTECWVTVKTTDALYRGYFTKRYGERRNKGFITSDGFMWWNTALAEIVDYLFLCFILCHRSRLRCNYRS